MISEQGYGYKLDIVDDDAYADFLEENHINDHHNNYQNITDINDRYNYLLNKLLFEQNEIYFDDLADELFVSRSTFLLASLQLYNGYLVSLLCHCYWL
ncbi:hypothetical protein Si021_01622 [Streptococcus infantarius subsp. infantarius]|nr:hypothetical protein [Streptococcus infantarius subsp. infantarius]MCO4497905.1 hypothetical protein [Streptococcus infantarius subsp. infantarius]MCO4645275.1 hypothetical protein [Streptococcus infantarius subsp. infantarius]MCO4661837.1 hypothetical protein [Streptococcus infantarius subsp. infantarius]